MVDNNPIQHHRKAGGVRFTADPDDSLTKHDEKPSNTNEFSWEQYCNEQLSFDLYFGILKLSHIYTMTMDVTFQQIPVQLEIILDQQQSSGLELLVTESPREQSDNRTNFLIEIIINPETIPGPFRRSFLLKEISSSQQRIVRVNVKGKILRQGQGTATLKDGVHMKAVLSKTNEDEE